MTISVALVPSGKHFTFSMLPVRCITALRAQSRHVPSARNSTAKTSLRRRQGSKQRLPRVKDKRCSVSIEPQQCKEVQRHSASHLTAASAAGLTSFQYFLASGNAYAAKVCLDVPDWIADFNLGDAVFHSPVVAVGAAVLALLLFPKLIKFSIKYLAFPAIIALLAWLAISHPQATANTVYTVLEFVKEHPAAASIGIIAVAGIILGPDLLAGAAVAGVAVLLAVQAGFVQLPALPVPRLPGQQLVAKQIDRAGKVIRQKITDLDDDDLVRPNSSGSSKREHQVQSVERVGNYRTFDPSSSNGSSSSRMQLTPMPAPATVESSAATNVPQQQQQQQQQQQLAPLITAQSSQHPGPMHQLQSATSQLRNKLEQAQKQVASQFHQQPQVIDQIQGSRDRVQDAHVPQGVGKAVQVLGDRVQGSQAVQGLGKGIQGLTSRIRGLTDMVQDSPTVQGLRFRAGAIGAGVLDRVQEGAGALKGRLSQQQQQVEEGVAVEKGSVARVEDNARSGRPVESILANS